MQGPPVQGEAAAHGTPGPIPTGTTLPPHFPGLTAADVAERIARGQTNAVRMPTSRSLGRIIRANVFTWFNLILGSLFALMVLFANWRDALFGIVLIMNTAIGIVQELRAKHTLDRLSLMTAPKAQVRRDGREALLDVTDVVLDDIVLLAPGDQVVADGEVLEADGLDLDESLLTGESVAVEKAAGDTVLSGSLVASGTGLFRATGIGADAYSYKIAAAGRRYTRVRSELVEGINSVLRVVGLMIIPVGGLFAWVEFSHSANLADDVTNTVAAVTAMIPQGLVLLTSIAFTVSALVLARRTVLVQEIPAVEGLARVDVLCLDKTGTITEGDPVFERLDPVGAAPDGPDRLPLATQALGALAGDTRTRNGTVLAIARALPAPADWTSEGAVPFSSVRKWSAARFAGRGTWVLGAPEMVLAASRAPHPAAEGAHGPAAADAAVLSRAQTLASGGSRVLLLATTEAPLTDETLPAGLRPVALVLLGEKVRSDAPETLRYFTDQDVGLKVISGDNPGTVQTIARAAGLPDAESAMDARELVGDDTFADVVERTAVFGRVTPDQKAAMVTALQSKGHTVAMTGDGVNDVLALKQSDLAVAMGTGSAATKAVAQLVLLDSKFSTLPGVVAEGRRVTANIERVASLFITKTVWASLAALSVAVLALPYPLLPRQLTLIDTFSIGVPAFFLALAPNKRRYRAGFMHRVMRFTMPVGLVIALAVLGNYLALRAMGPSLDQTRTLTTLLLSVSGLRVITILEAPVRGWRLGLVLAMASLLALTFAIPLAREFFVLTVPTRQGLAVTAGITVLVCIVMGLVGRRPPGRHEPRRAEETT